MHWVLYIYTTIKDRPTYSNVLQPRPVNASHDMQASGLIECSSNVQTSTSCADDSGLQYRAMHELYTHRSRQESSSTRIQ